MKILSVCDVLFPQTVGGAGRLAREVTAALKEMGKAVEFLTRQVSTPLSAWCRCTMARNSSRGTCRRNLLSTEVDLAIGMSNRRLGHCRKNQPHNSEPSYSILQLQRRTILYVNLMDSTAFIRGRWLGHRREWLLERVGPSLAAR